MRKHEREAKADAMREADFWVITTGHEKPPQGHQKSVQMLKRILAGQDGRDEEA